MGEAGRRRAIEQFPASELVRRVSLVYQELQGQARGHIGAVR
jgi:hypothetical protein